MGIQYRLWKLALLAFGLSFALHGAAVTGYLTNLVIAGNDPFTDPRAMSFLHQSFLIQVLELGAMLFLAFGASEFYGSRIKEKISLVPGESVATAAVLSIFFAWTMIPYLTSEEPQQDTAALSPAPPDRSLASDKFR